jgi:Asp-tRNA(Asn)/Glu-tRNA(Gln) amidotransferase A subunit family amidase
MILLQPLPYLLVTENPARGFLPTNLQLTRASKTAIPLRDTSRLYCEVTEAQPLAGLHLAVKDTIDVKGVKSSCRSIAYYRLYDKPAKSASALKVLTDLGAVVVGKTRANQFASGDQPTADWVASYCPYNACK